MIFHGCVKECKISGRGGAGERGDLKVSNWFGDGPIKVVHCAKKKTMKRALDAPQLIKLINMNQNKYPNYWKSLNQKYEKQN
jgi:hypothetical protein